MNLGNTIKSLRVKKNLKQKEFASECGIAQAYLSQIENNQREPNLSVLKTIATHLGIPLPFLVFLSMDISDVQDEKVEMFKQIEPSLKGLVTQFSL
ncbi:helix-turn-helix domain-containing protein [Salinimicrobium flavum]|uniref:Helix-turn-helix domain-containing protein n=1 Tax=Salinimicrobium flavum TaxID=1737065 RepID=A0ABW5IRT2_9FLAO